MSEPFSVTLDAAVEGIKAYRPHDGRMSWVYFAGWEPLDIGTVIKIGRTRNLKKRMYDISRACGKQVVPHGVVGGYSYQEVSIHDAFTYLRVHGEWFRVDEHLLTFIKTYAMDADTEGRAA